MTLEIALVLVAALGLLVTERLRGDVVGLLVLVTLAVTGIVTPEAALAGFSNPAVVTVLAMYILSEGLTRTGIAGLLGGQLVAIAGSGEARLTVAIMVTAGTLSAFMNNIGVAALLLPVVVEIARRTEVPASRLLLPMLHATLLGGLTTLFSTPPNLIANAALAGSGATPFRLLDFLPSGLAAFVVGHPDFRDNRVTTRCWWAGRWRRRGSARRRASSSSPASTPAGSRHCPRATPCWPPATASSCRAGSTASPSCAAGAG